MSIMVIQLTPPNGKWFGVIRHTREGGYPELLEKTGFPFARE
jgi:hypothetical protein